MKTRVLTLSLLGIALLTAACSGGACGDDDPTASPTTVATATATATPTSPASTPTGTTTGTATATATATQGTPTTTATETPELTATGGELTADAALSRSADAVEALQSFHFILTHENGGTPIALGLTMERAEGDIVVPDRMYADVNASAAGLGVDVEAIAIGDQLWITNPFNGNWQELEGSLEDNQILNPSTAVASALRNGLDNATLGDGGEVNDEETHLVEGTTDSGTLGTFAPGAQPGTPIQVRVWMRRSDFTPVRIRLEGPLSPDEAEDMARQLDLSNFNEPVEINPPQ